MKGYVYVLTDGTATKVGVSKNHPRRRVAQLQTGNSNPIRCYAYRQVAGYLEVEREAHRRLKARHRRLEWFNVPPADALAVVDAIIAERRRPIHRQFVSLWNGLRALAQFAMALLCVVGAGWLWLRYDLGVFYPAQVEPIFILVGTGLAALAVECLWRKRKS